MKIKSMTAVFGKLTGEKLELQPGFNLIEAPNEGGKSTWAAFLKAMLYGIDTRDRDKKGYLADKNRYQPWSGAPMEGEITLEWQGRDITIRRSPKGNTPFGTFEAVYTGTQEPVPGLTGADCGELLLGVGREVFERSAFLGQSGSLAIQSAPELERRIAALVSSGEEDVSFSETEQTLKGWLNRRKHNKTGLIPQLEEELSALEGDRSAAVQNQRRLREAQVQSQALESRKEELESEQNAQRARRDWAVLEQYSSAVKELRKAQEALAALQEENQAQTQSVARLNQEKLDLEGERVKSTRESQSLNEQLLRTEGEVSRLDQRRVSASMEEKQLLDKLWETYELSHEAAKQQRVEIESVQKASRRIAELKRSISTLGNVNVGAIEEFQRVNERYTYLTDQRDDVDRAKKELEEIISSITAEMKTIFAREFGVINEAFQQTFQELFGGGRAALELEDPDDILNCGIEIKVQPPGKALKIITLLSGGEKAFVAIALYFAILKVRPTPFVVMDEIEAALDDVNVVRFAQYLRRISDKTQFVVITHRRGTMEAADVLYGVTMQEDGVSKLLKLELDQVDAKLIT